MQGGDSLRGRKQERVLSQSKFFGAVRTMRLFDRLLFRRKSFKIGAHVIFPVSRWLVILAMTLRSIGEPQEKIFATFAERGLFGKHRLKLRRERAFLALEFAAPRTKSSCSLNSCLRRFEKVRLFNLELISFFGKLPCPQIELLRSQKCRECILLRHASPSKMAEISRASGLIFAAANRFSQLCSTGRTSVAPSKSSRMCRNRVSYCPLATKN